MVKLKACPFCGKPIIIKVCDDEGNIRSDEYEDDPWSGLHYVLVHDEDIAGNFDGVVCPIATSVGNTLGMYIYDSRAEAIITGNMRNGKV